MEARLAKFAGRLPSISLAFDSETSTRVHPKHRCSQSLVPIWVHIVCYQDPYEWILGKIARRLCENLTQMGVRTEIGCVPEPRADINHHVCYWDYDGQKSSIDTLMVTHIDSDTELAKLKRQLVSAEMGICMSSTEITRLARLGVPREKLCYINPGHDYAIKPRKIVVGITTRLYDDGRKRERMLLDLHERFPLKDFKFTIMGAGWSNIVDMLRQRGVEVEYFDRFKPRKYRKLIPNLDYYLYMGQDEGSMGFIDALTAGIPTIVTPQGFHLDALPGITYAFNDLTELAKVFKKIAAKKVERIKAVTGWTFAENARRHLCIWEYLLARKACRPIATEVQHDLRQCHVSLPTSSIRVSSLESATVKI